MTNVEAANSKDATASRQHPPAPADSRENAERVVQAAFDRSTSANESGTSDARVSAVERLQDAVDDARDIGVEWGRIGAILGIARGNAYHRHRKRPQ